MLHFRIGLSMLRSHRDALNLISVFATSAFVAGNISGLF